MNYYSLVGGVPPFLQEGGTWPTKKQTSAEIVNWNETFAYISIQIFIYILIL